MPTFASFKAVVLFEELGNVRGFRVFDFSTYTEVKNTENSEIFSRLVNFKKIVLHEKVENVCDFWVLEFWPYIKIGNIFKNCKFPRLRFI